MHEARATDSKRTWTVFAAALLLLLVILWILLRERRNAAAGVNAARGIVAASSPSEESAAEMARRKAIAALGPIKRRDGINATDLYKQAIGFYAELTAEEKAMLKHPRDKADPKTAAALYAKIQPIMDLLRKARKADYIDWGFGPPSVDDIKASLALVLPIGNLGALALWDATYRFQSDSDGAVGDVAAMDALGRSGGGTLIGLLVGDGIQASGMYLLAQNAASITSAVGPDLAYIVNSVAIEQAFQNGLNADSANWQAFMESYANPATRSEVVSAFGSIGRDPATSPEETASGMAWLLQTERALASTLMEPEPQFQQWWNQKLAQAASMPAVNGDGALPSFIDARSRAQALIVENAMFEAGIALEQNNQAQFQSIIDPFTGQRFTYTQTVNGLQLGSSFRLGGKPMTLSFPAPVAR